MKYITQEDLVTDSYERFITESSQDTGGVIDRAEARAIAYATSLLQERYDTAKIFDETKPVREVLLVDIISKITLYYIFKRNAARKVSSDIKDDYDWAIKELEKIHTGRIKLNLPPLTDGTGKAVSTSMYGNNSNSDFYI